MHPVLFHLGALVIPSYGAVAALGLLLALMLALRIAKKTGVDPNRIWNLCILMLFTALIGSRLLLVAANWNILRSHPLWVLSIATVHHPLLAAIAALIAFAVAAVYAGLHRMPLRATADLLAAPLALGLSFEQIGALLAGSGYGTGTHLPWAVIYTDPLAARWSDAPLGIPVHPVQAYAAICLSLIAATLILQLPRRHQHGDLAGNFLISTGFVMYITEFWRDPVGRGALFHGFIKGPQVAAILLVLLGAAFLLDRPSQRILPAPSAPTTQPAPHATSEPTHG
ncbi:prolipoprotein diacylglyceryl transferase family protein [Occallatibacter savannae]|uniref:prolipoprotein diacylglyceryl transferase family protein n=1 Tax=Occallatibacter savannae TaxID=1002691 RepID=UPI000D693594|nr:prolipoprotein diacylglyceryl transferase family protein [Occallatibacter savannae]